jgi:hypothetical protein
LTTLGEATATGPGFTLIGFDGTVGDDPVPEVGDACLGQGADGTLSTVNAVSEGTGGTLTMFYGVPQQWLAVWTAE